LPWSNFAKDATLQSNFNFTGENEFEEESNLAENGYIATKGVFAEY
jgi:hypothetical protein